MEKQPFNSAGFAALQLQLYALPDAELATEATHLSTNFTQWMANHFELDPAQLAFLNGLATATLSFLAQQTSTCVAIAPSAQEMNIGQVACEAQIMCAKREV